GLVLGRAGPSGRRGGRVAADRADPRRARRCGGVRRRIPLWEGGHRQPLGLRDPQGRAVLGPRRCITSCPICGNVALLSPRVQPRSRGSWCNYSGMGGVSTDMEAETKHPAARRRDARGTAILVIASLWSLLHVYVGQRLLAQTSLAPAWRVVGWVGILLLVLAPFVALVAGRTERLPAKRGLEVAGFTAMGLSSLLIVFALAGDVLHVRAWLGVGGSQLAVVGGATAVLLIGLWRARRPATVRVVD